MNRNESELLSAALNELADCLALMDQMAVIMQTIRTKIDRLGNAGTTYLDTARNEHAREDEFNSKREKETLQ